MSLLNLSNAKYDEKSGNKPYAILRTQMIVATTIGEYHTPWIDLATYSAISDMYCSERSTSRWYAHVKYDDFGRIKRTEMWQ